MESQTLYSRIRNVECLVVVFLSSSVSSLSLDLIVRD